MSSDAAIRLALFGAAILGATILGGVLPLIAPLARRRMPLALSFAAGVLLGAAFFHMLPDAVSAEGPSVLYVIPVGFLALYLLERYLLVHACGPDEDCEVHALGLAAFVGIAFHSLTEGVALGASLESPAVSLSVFFAVILHKVPESFALALILRGARYQTLTILCLLGAFVLAFFIGTLVAVVFPALTASTTARALALAFAGGTFLHVALSDLLPMSHREKENRAIASVATIAGLGGMYLLAAVG